ncbi:MAG TPA: metalloregulator ArsR/SmtB family transcription factor [Steroidobacteraceae bacterium]|nr:metalloregulator ArsR/SmtB family transcription factor [Steroidobacteraceae bacterium]
MVESRVFQALADPTRRAVFERLCRREMSVAEITAGFPVSQPAISQHLATLRRAGLVSERREGRKSLYRCDPAGLEPLTAWVQRYRQFWPERLARLKRVLKEIEP